MTVPSTRFVDLITQSGTVPGFFRRWIVAELQSNIQKNGGQARRFTTGLGRQPALPITTGLCVKFGDSCSLRAVAHPGQLVTQGARTDAELLGGGFAVAAAGRQGAGDQIEFMILQVALQAAGGALASSG